MLKTPPALFHPRVSLRVLRQLVVNASGAETHAARRVITPQTTP
jgi:hypothetical protein